MSNDVLIALEDEGNRLERLLVSLDGDAWDRPSVCAGWTVADVVLHLAQTEEAVSAAVAGEPFEITLSSHAAGVDDLMAGWVAAQRGAPHDRILERWKTAHRGALAALRRADPRRAVAWVATPLKPRTLATTRLAEHWIHAHDIADPLGVDLPDTDSLWHVARLAHRTLPYAFARAGRGDAPTVRLELRSPDGEAWTFGADDASCVISGSAGEFCRVAARRLQPGDAPTLEARGPRAAEVLELVRTYA